jgi:hypothetical protein
MAKMSVPESRPPLEPMSDEEAEEWAELERALSALIRGYGAEADGPAGAAAPSEDASASG